jgi:hypothetical protein
MRRDGCFYSGARLAMAEHSPLKKVPPKKDRILLNEDTVAVLMEKGDLFETGYPVALRAALWTDFFLTGGTDDFKKKWSRLPLEEKIVLGTVLFKGYLHQPMFLRLWPEKGEKIPQRHSPVTQKGKLLQTVFNMEDRTIVQIYYPLPHDRLWPELLEILLDDFFPSESVRRILGQELALVALSRLPHLRQRGQTLQTRLAAKTIEESPRGVAQSGGLSQEGEGDSSAQGDNSTPGPNPPTYPDSPPEIDPVEEAKPGRSGKRKKKKKSADEQMKFF